MNGLLLLVAAAATGVDVGWQPLAGGGYEYIIQIEPQALAAMEQGRDLVSDLPPQLRDVRRYRITIGTGPVPRIGTPPEMTDPAALDGTRSTQTGTGPALPAPPATNDPFASSRSGTGNYTNDPYNTGNNTLPAGGSIGVSDPRLGAATGLAAPLPSRLPISDPYGNDRYQSGTGTNTGATNNQPSNMNPGTVPSNQQGTGYTNDPRTNLPAAGTTDPFGYNNTQPTNMQDPRLQNGGQMPMNPAYPPNPGYQNPTNPQGNTINWPTNPQNPIPGNTMPPANYGAPMAPPANYNNPPQNTPPGYNPQQPFNNPPQANYNQPPVNNTPPANWPTNTLADNSRNTATGTGNQIPKPFLDETELPRASFHSGAEGDKATATPQWFPFTMALLMLFVSLGGNAYLGWIALTLRNKYLALLEKLRRRMKI